MMILMAVVASTIVRTPCVVMPHFLARFAGAVTMITCRAHAFHSFLDCLERAFI
jgi:hypothetical protein